jgi:pimeloyl-ACP methyl ester carboxylesterase
MARFLLVHGAWHGGWCWEQVVGELAARGHTAVAPDLPCDDVEAGAAAYAQAVGDDREAIVVAHSLAGLTIPLVAARLHVFLAALVPTPGEVFNEDEALDPAFGGTVRDGLARSYWPDGETTAARMYPELSTATVASAFALLRRQARAPSVEPSPVTGMPRASAYVVCSRDRIVRPEWQRWAAREVLGVEPVGLGSGHFPMLERPRALAALLEGLAAQPG